ncbi:MAG: hypothetical protein AAF330_00045 [Pseudomonadota bacterium]
MVEITDEDSAKAWLEGQDHQTRIWMAARAALRALPAVKYHGDQAKVDELAFVSFRATLISVGASKCRSGEVGSYQQVADAAAASAYATSTAAVNDAASYFTLSTADAASRSSATVSNERAIANSASTIVAASSAVSTKQFVSASSAKDTPAAAAAYLAVSKDTEAYPTWGALWPIEDISPVEALFNNWETLKTNWSQGHNADHWAFWVWWYQHLLDGTAPQKLWDLTHRIALEITDEEWEWEDGKAPARVAARIRKIEAEWEEKSGPTTPAPEPVDPETVIDLFTRAPIVEASMLSMSATITQHVRAFEKEACWNEPLPFVQALDAIPLTAQKIATTLATGEATPDALTKLALEVGELRAEVRHLQSHISSLRTELRKLKSAGEKPPSWGRSAAAFLPGAVRAVAVCIAGAFALGTTDKTLIEIADKLLGDWVDFQACLADGEDLPADEDFVLTLPPTFKT